MNKPAIVTRQPFDAQAYVKKIADMKGLDLAHALNPQAMTADLRDQSLMDQAARSALLRLSGATASLDIKNLKLTTDELTQKIANGLSSNPAYTTDAQQLDAAKKLVTDERAKMNEANYAPPILKDKDGKSQFVVPRIGDIAQQLAPEKDKAAVKKVLDDSFGLQAVARSFYNLNWPDKDPYMGKANLRAADEKNNPLVYGAQKRMNELIEGKPGLDRKAERNNVRADLGKLLAGMPDRSEAQTLARVIGVGASEPAASQTHGSVPPKPQQ